MIAAGSPAPDFSLRDQQGRTVSLKDFRGRPLVLFFYPGDFTPVCTKEACAFRDQYEVFKQAGAEVIGISRDPADSHQRFAAHHQLPFPLLSDPDMETARRYGVGKLLGLLPGRATFVIDGDGVVRHAFSSAFRARAHVEEALRILKTLA